MTAASWSARAIVFAVLTVGVAVGYWWTLSLYFLADDFAYVERFWAMSFVRWPALFVREWSEGMWGFPLRELRPVSALTLMVDARLWGATPAGYHFTNVALHLVCSCLVTSIAIAARPGRWIAAVAAGLVFALHPVHIEPVAWITGRADLLGSLGLLLGFYSLLIYRSSASVTWLATAWGAYAAGVFSKEFCLTLPLIALVYEIVVPAPPARSRPHRLAPYVGWALIAGIYFVCRSIAVAEPGAGAIGLEWTEKTFWRAFAQREMVYLGELFWPIAAWLPTSDRDRVFALRLLLRVVAVVVVAVGVWWWYERHQRSRDARTVFFFLVVWWFATTLPFVVTYVSARHLYVASAGLCIGVMVVVDRLMRRKALFIPVALVMTIGCGLRLQQASASWRTASLLSRSVSATIQDVASKAAPGDLLLLDVPGVLDGSWVWAWASPFALRPPFQPIDVPSRLLVLERDDLYFHPERWSAHPTIPRLQGHAGAVWIVTTEPDVVVRRAEAGRLAAALQSGTVRFEQPGAFRRLVTALRENPR